MKAYRDGKKTLQGPHCKSGTSAIPYAQVPEWRKLGCSLPIHALIAASLSCSLTWSLQLSFLLQGLCYTLCACKILFYPFKINKFQSLDRLLLEVVQVGTLLGYFSA